MKSQYDVFISYRREGGIDTARTFYDRLTAMGYRASFDIETLRNGKFNVQLYNRIDECKDVIVILNRTALELRENPDDDWLRLEVAHALKAGKNIIPVFLRDFKRPKPGTLPPDIADLLDYQGVTSSDEHFDSTFDRICDLLTAKPCRRCRKVALLVGLGLVSLAAGIGVWSWRDRLFPYPATQVDRQRVGALAGNLLLWSEAFNNLMGKEMALVEKARLSIETDDSSSYEGEVEVFKHGLVELKKQLSRCEPSPKLMTDIEQMPVDSAGFPVFLESVRQDFSMTDDLLQNLERAVKYKSIMSKADRLRQVDIEKESIQYRCRIYATGIMGVFCHVSDESIADFKKVAMQWDRLPDLAKGWLKDEKEIERVGMSLCGQYEKLMGELSTIVGNLNVSLGQDRDKLRGELMANGATADQAAEMVRQMEKGQLPGGREMPELPVPKTPEELRENLRKLGATPEQIEGQVAKLEKLMAMRARLEKSQDSIKELKEKARVKFAPTGQDDPGLLWGKFIKFQALSMPKEANDCLEMLKARNSSEFPAAALKAGKAYYEKFGTLPFDGGVLVCHFAPPATSHAIFQIGDIVTAVDGKKCRIFADYKAQLKDGKILVIWRLDDRGEFVRHEKTMPPGQPLTAFVDLTDK